MSKKEEERVESGSDAEDEELSSEESDVGEGGEQGREEKGWMSVGT
jgi:hypothetical protein